MRRVKWGMETFFRLGRIRVGRSAARPVPGTTKVHRLQENVGAAAVQLAEGDREEIETAAAGFEAYGDRYSDAAQRMINR